VRNAPALTVTAATAASDVACRADRDMRRP
jgi:hypothetical protein